MKMDLPGCKKIFTTNKPHKPLDVEHYPERGCVNRNSDEGHMERSDVELSDT